MLISKEATFSFTSEDIKKLIQAHIQKEANLACDLKDISIDTRHNEDMYRHTMLPTVSASAKVRLN